MKVSEVIKDLSTKFDPDEHVCVLVYDKSMFDYDEDDEIVLTDEGWLQVVNDFENTEFNDIWESIGMAVVDYAIEKEM
jgi:hypothetical protein